MTLFSYSLHYVHIEERFDSKWQCQVQLSPGVHQLCARAENIAGTSACSAPAQVTVDPDMLAVEEIWAVADGIRYEQNPDTGIMLIPAYHDFAELVGYVRFKGGKPQWVKAQAYYNKIASPYTGMLNPIVTVEGMAADHGPAGSTVTVTGSNFGIERGESRVLFDGAEAVAELSVAEAAGARALTADFDGGEGFMPSHASAPLDVSAEGASLAYRGSYLVRSGEAVTLAADLTEEDDGSPGDIARAGEVAFEIYDPAGNAVKQLSAPTVETSPGAGKAEATLDSLPANVYTVKARLAENGYYRAEAVEAQLVVYDPCGGFATGGGFLLAGGLKTFGFCVKPSGTAPWLPKGNLLLVDLEDVRRPLTVKATGFAWLVIPPDRDIAYVAGTCALNRQEGYTFRLTVEDLGGWLSRLDTFHLVHGGVKMYTLWRNKNVHSNPS